MYTFIKKRMPTKTIIVMSSQKREKYLALGPMIPGKGLTFIHKHSTFRHQWLAVGSVCVKKAIG